MTLNFILIIQMQIQAKEKQKTDSMNTYQYVCLNPNCKQSTSRLISINTQDIIKHDNCNGWILNIQYFKNRHINQESHQTTTFNRFNLKDQPLKSIISFQKLFSTQSLQDQFINPLILGSDQNDAIKLLEYNFDQIRSKIQYELQKQFSLIKQRILNLKRLNTKTIQEVNKIVKSLQTRVKSLQTKIKPLQIRVPSLQTGFKYQQIRVPSQQTGFTSQQTGVKSLQTQDASQQTTVLGLQTKKTKQINQMINSSQVLKQYEQFTNEYYNLTLIKDQLAFKELNLIYNNIATLNQCFWVGQKDTRIKQQQIISKAIKQQEVSFKDQSIHAAIRLQNFSGIFGMKNPQTRTSQDKKTVWAKCWLCQSQIASFQAPNLKQKKTQCSKNLLTHIFSQHRVQTNEKLLQKCLKSSNYEITLKHFLFQIEQKPYQQFIIIDKQNQSSRQFRKDQKCYEIQVMSMRNANLAMGRFILAQSQGKDAADTMVIMLVYAILNSGYYRPAYKPKHSFNTYSKLPTITIMTKDHFAQTLSSIIKNQFGVQIIIKK